MPGGPPNANSQSSGSGGGTMNAPEECERFEVVKEAELIAAREVREMLLARSSPGASGSRGSETYNDTMAMNEDSP